MIKLLYVENSLAIYGGVERVLVDKLNWLAEYGHCEVRLLTANQGKHPVVFSLNLNVKSFDVGIPLYQIYSYSWWKRYYLEYRLHKKFQQRLSEVINRESPHIIICTRLDYVYDVIKVKGEIPMIYESHDSFLMYKFERLSFLRRFRILLYYQCLKKAQTIVSLTHGDAMKWRKLTPKVVVIPNSVHLNNSGRYSDCCSKSVIFVGRYSYQKDIRILVKIWGEVQLRHPDWHLHIFGGYGELQKELVTYIRKTDMNIVIHQPTSGIFEEYMKNSILLMTSRYEPFGLVLPEAMSCGLPVVAFDCPYGPADIISDGIDGFLIKDRDIGAYVEKVCLLMDNLELRQKMGAAGIESSQKYAASQIMPQWIKLFKNLINN